MTFSEVLYFLTFLRRRFLDKILTGSWKIPATGLNKNVIAKFKQGCFPNKSGTMWKCLPTVSTCEIVVNIPVHITSEKDMMHYYVKIDLVLFKSFTSAGHTHEKLVLFLSNLSIQYMFKTFD